MHCLWVVTYVSFTGVPVGFFSAPLKQMVPNFEEHPDAYDHLNKWTWIELSSAENTVGFYPFILYVHLCYSSNAKPCLNDICVE